ncbi:myosin-11 isoform X1, partial [Tanacetum coccineum]
MFPKSTQETFSNKLYQTFRNHKRFVKPKLSRTDFTIAHYAGEVQYQSNQFLDKNKDYVVPEHQDLLGESRCPFVAGLFPPIAEESPKSSKFFLVGSRFKLQLQQLMETLSATEHQICGKTGGLGNGLKLVMAYSSLRMSAIKVKAAVRALKARKEFKLQKQTRAIIKIQTRWRCHRSSSHYKRLKKGVIVTQRRWRGKLAKKELRKRKMPARETGALKKAKDKLAKQLEDPTLRLQLEKRLRTDLEEAKASEAHKFQTSLEALQKKLAEANATVVKEKEAARKAIQEAPPVVQEKEIIIEDTKRIESLTKEVNSLKALLDSEKQQSASLQKKYAESQECSEERLRKLEDSENKVQQLQDSLSRLEEKLQNLESENKVFRQQAVSMTPNKFLLRSKSILQRSDSGHLYPDTKPQTLVLCLELGANDLPSVSMNQRDLSELDDKPQKSLNEKQVENQELLIKCIAQHIGFSGDIPIAACIIYKCLIQWRSFEVERTTVFDRIIQTIGQAIEKSQDNNDILAYWLSNASTLLLLLQRTLKASGATAGLGPQRRRSSATLFGRVNNSFRGVPQGVNLPFVNGNPLSALDAVSQVEAKYPALLFKQQLTAYVEKIYGMIRDNLKKEISPLLGLCIQAPRTSRASLVKGASRSVNNAAQQALIAHWQGIVKGLGDFLNTLKTNHVPPFLVRKIFTQIFSFINVQLFNSLLLRRECCSFSNGEYVKAGLAELRDWCHNATDEYAGTAWEELKHIRQAIGFLVIHQKPKKTLEEISRGLCPVLSVQQLYRISTMYWDDKYGTHSVSPDVTFFYLNSLDPFVAYVFFTGIPFSVDDISKSMKQIEISDVDPPPIIRDNSGFSFLLPRAD